MALNPAAPDAVASAKDWPAPVRALAHRNFRFYFAGQAVSILGSWVQQVALSWLVYRITGSAALLGVTAFAALLPQLVVGPLAGAWIDRHDKRRLLIAVQALLALQALALSLLTAWQAIGPALIVALSVALSVALGVLNAFDTPLRQSLIGSFVGPKTDLPNALALNAMLFNSGRFVGPPLAGLLVGLTSEATCFALNAGSFLALMLGLLLIRSEAPPRAKGSMADVFREGLAYARTAYPIRVLIITLAALNITASSYALLLPVFAKDVFGGDAQTLGWLWGAAGGGAFGATVFLATRETVAGLVRIVVAGVALSAAALLVFAFNRQVLLALAAMALLGFGISVCNVGINMLLQSLAPDHLRGRVVSFFTSTRFGFDAIGGLLAGLLAARIGAPAALCVEAVLLSSFIAWLLGVRGKLGTEVSQQTVTG
jgi:MFS family permease